VQQDNGSSGTFGLRAGRWKLHRHDKQLARNFRVNEELANTGVPKFQLFDLMNDPSESKVCAHSTQNTQNPENKYCRSHFKVPYKPQLIVLS